MSDTGETPNKLSLTSYPQIFVLPTHLSLDELHQVEDKLIQHNASLTYDISEAKLVLGRLAQKKRAALELRSRGIWTEEIPLPAPEPPAKRRRLRKSEQDSSVDANAPEQYIDLSTETEDEEDGVTSKHDSRQHLKRPRSASPPTSLNQPDAIKVVKLEWLDDTLDSHTPLPLTPYTIYNARKITRPAPSTPTATASDILQRAKQDAAAKASSSPAPFSPRRGGPSSTQHPHPPPKLLRHTTSEDDDTIPLPPTPAWVKNRVLYACQRSAPLHPPNEGFISQLLDIRKIRELTLDEIGVRAYSTSIAAIAAYPYEFRRASQVLTLPGCESKIAHLFAEYQQSEHGELAAARELHTDPVLRVLNSFHNIWGVGAKTAREFYFSRGYRDLDDIIEHGWSTLSRVQQIGLKYHDELAQGIPRPEVEEIARVVHRHANRVRPDVDGSIGGGVQCILVGGYRRGKDRCGDVDLILTHRDEGVTMNLVVDVLASLEAEGWVTHTLALNMATSARDQHTLPWHGDSHHFDSLDKALVVWQDPSVDAERQAGDGRKPVNTNPHRRVDIIISPWRTIGCAVLGWTGDTTFERDLRRFAKKAHGWKFDSSGVRERTSGGQVLDLEGQGRTWEERERLVMEGLGVGWREPGERCTR